MKIVIVDDHPLVRKGLASLFAASPDIEVAGEGSCVREAVELIASSRPDLALVDLKLGRECGIDVIAQCRQKGIVCRFVILTSSSDSGDFRRARNAGIDGYILKDALPEEILYAVRLVQKGRVYYDPSLMNLAIDSENSLESALTPREKEVLIALGRGSKNSQIAKDLFVTEFTVKKYVSQILDKLDLKDRTQAALYAVNSGIVR